MKDEELLLKYFKDECVKLLASKDFGYSVEEAKGICGRKDITDTIKRAIKEVKEGNLGVDDAVEELRLVIGTKVEPKVAVAPPKVRRIPRVAAPPEWSEMAERIMSDYPDLLAIASLGDIQRMHGPELGMTSRDLPYVADILDRMLAEMGRDKMKAPKNVREYYVGWILAVGSSQIVEINVERAVDEVWDSIRHSIKQDRPDIFEEIEPVTYKIALEGGVMSNLGVGPDQMPDDVRKAYELVEMWFGAK